MLPAYTLYQCQINWRHCANKLYGDKFVNVLMAKWVIGFLKTFGKLSAFSILTKTQLSAVQSADICSLQPVSVSDRLQHLKSVHCWANTCRTVVLSCVTQAIQIIFVFALLDNTICLHEPDSLTNLIICYNVIHRREMWNLLNLLANYS